MITYKRYFNKNIINEGGHKIEDYYGNKKIIWTSSGRGSIEYLIDIIGFQDNEYVLLPAFVAEGLIRPFKRKKIKFLFYKSNSELIPDTDDIKELLNEFKVKLIVVIHYFGYPQNIKLIRDFTDNRNILILEDCAQALFSCNGNGILLGTEGDFAVFSLPKFLPVPDGSFIIVNNSEYMHGKIKYRKSLLHFFSVISMIIYLYLKTFHVNKMQGGLSGVINPILLLLQIVYYYSTNYANNPVKISGYTLKNLQKFNYEKFISKRQNNILNIFKLQTLPFWKFLPVNINKINLTGIPLIAKNRKEIIRKLKNNKIEVLTYTKRWNFFSENEKSRCENEMKFYDEHFLLPVSENITEESFEKYFKTLTTIFSA